MPDKKQPFCWKCNSAMTILTKDDDSFKLIGCTECSDIKNYDDAQKLCPLFDHSPKVVIAVIDGECSIVEKPDNVLVEVRDYVEVDDDETDGYHEDEKGDFYRVFSFPATKIKFSANGPSCFTDVEIRFNNHYYCRECEHDWEEKWSSVCDSECPHCGKPYSPISSDDISQSIGWQPSPADYPLAGLQTFEVYEDLEMGKGCHPEVRNWIEIFEGVIEKPVIIPSDKEDTNKHITILQHDISYFLRDTDLSMEIDDSSREHVEDMIGQGYSEGDLFVTDFNNDITYSGYWKIVK